MVPWRFNQNRRKLSEFACVCEDGGLDFFSLCVNIYQSAVLVVMEKALLPNEDNKTPFVPKKVSLTLLVTVNKFFFNC